MYFLFADFRGEIIIIIIIIINLYSANIFGQSRAQHSTGHKFKLATTPLHSTTATGGPQSSAAVSGPP